MAERMPRTHQHQEKKNEVDLSRSDVEHPPRHTQLKNEGQEARQGTGHTFSFLQSGFCITATRSCRHAHPRVVMDGWRTQVLHLGWGYVLVILTIGNVLLPLTSDLYG